MPRAPQASHRVIKDFACLRCGLVCDDIELHIDRDEIVRSEHACELGAQWLQSPPALAAGACRIRGSDATLDQAVEEAARLLTQARYPLIFGLTATTTQAQRAAVELADRIGAAIDIADRQHAAASIALQTVGQVTCSLGEIRHRSDVIVFWGADPESTHPRLWGRLVQPSLGLPPERQTHDRRCIVIDPNSTATAKRADQFIRVDPSRQFEIIWTLRSLVRGQALDDQQVLQATGHSLQVWQPLIDMMKSARYGAIFFGDRLVAHPGDHANVEALFSLVRDLNRHTRFVCLANQSASNSAGAQDVITWQSGYPPPVSFSLGYPRYNPVEYSAETVLSRREADVALVIGGGQRDSLSAAARRYLESIPTIRIATPVENESDKEHSAVRLSASTAGIHHSGTVFRMDHVPIELRAALPTPLPSDLEILERILQRVPPLEPQP